MRSRWSAGLFLAAVASLVAGCGGGASNGGDSGSSTTVTVTGELKLGAFSMDLQSIENNTPRKGAGAFAFVKAGAQVVISDSSGTTLGIGKLVNEPYKGSRPAGCYFKFSVPGVATDSKFYKIAVAGHSDFPQLTKAQMVKPVNLKVGRGA